MQLAGTHVPGQPRGVRDPDLADQHPVGVGLGHGPPGPVDLMHVVAVDVGMRRAGRLVLADVAQGGVLGQQGR